MCTRACILLNSAQLSSINGMRNKLILDTSFKKSQKTADAVWLKGKNCIDVAEKRLKS